MANDLLSANVAKKNYEQSLSRVARMQQRLEGVFASGDETQLPT